MQFPAVKLYQPTKEQQLADRIFATKLPGLYYLEHKQFEDNRGFYAEIGLVPDLETVIGKPFVVKQMNQARSKAKIARGLHAENWNKLVTITSGSAYCALVDVRPESHTFAQVEYLVLGQSNQGLNGSIFISAGIANSYCVLDAPVDYVYWVDQLYRERDQSGDVAISLFDPDLQLQWPLTDMEMIRSDRDKQAINLRQKFPSKFK